MKYSILNMSDNNKRILFYMMLSSVILYFIFLPGVSFLYHTGDDYRYAFGGLGKACIKDDGFEFMITLGRPLQAYMDCAVFKFAYTLERMKMIRIFSVVLMGCALGLILEW